jgi:hypothetical protein
MPFPPPHTPFRQTFTTAFAVGAGRGLPRRPLVHIRIPEIDGLTQTRHPGEIEDLARSYIAVSTGQPIDTIAVHITAPGVGW